MKWVGGSISSVRTPKARFRAILQGTGRTCSHYHRTLRGADACAKRLNDDMSILERITDPQAARAGGEQ